MAKLTALVYSFRLHATYTRWLIRVHTIDEQLK